MPSSRKRNKGKERKAKKAAEKEETKNVAIYHSWQKWACGDMGQNQVTIQCNHGFVTTIPDVSHPVSRFINSSYASDGGRVTVHKHPEVWNDSSYRALASKILTSIGVNCILHGVNCPNSKQNVSHMALVKAIMMLENFTGDIDSTILRRTFATKLRHIESDVNIVSRYAIGLGQRDLLKFYRKRMNCSCLKRLHLVARKMYPKLGECYNCKVEMNRTMLMVCSRCMVTKYCSRECQVAASPQHRNLCDMFVNAHEEQQQQAMANDTT